MSVESVVKHLSRHLSRSRGAGRAESGCEQPLGAVVCWVTRCERDGTEETGEEVTTPSSEPVQSSGLVVGERAVIFVIRNGRGSEGCGNNESRD